ncbi:MAG: PAS domain-containing protein [Burkholderiaceae bacterium]
MLWIGSVFIAAIVTMAVYDIVRGHRATIAEAGRELGTQARVIAEQTARSVQAVDIVLRHVAEQFHRDAVARLDPEQLRAFLKEQAVGLVQIDGLILLNADGTVRAASYADPASVARLNLSGTPAFAELRDGSNPGPLLNPARRSVIDDAWMFQMTRRLETPAGEFLGVLGARFRVDYFQGFYRDVQLGHGTTVALVHRDGTLLARHPGAEALLGKPFVRLEEQAAAGARSDGMPLRAPSPVDGVDRLAALRLIPDYPLAVFVTRDASAALAPWRAQAFGSVARTLALAALAATLLTLLMRQFRRLNRALDSLQASKERFSVAVAGSDDGIWDWDYRSGRAFASVRAREILAMARAPLTQSIDSWFRDFESRIHPEDVPARQAAIRAHLAGRTPAYEAEYRVRNDDGSFRWIHVRGVCSRGPDGKLLRMAGSVTDIDARRRAEESLRQSEERYALAMRGSRGGHWVWDLETDTLYVSEALNRLFGQPPELQSTPRPAYFALATIHPDDLARFKRIESDITAERTTSVEIEYRIVLRATGETRWIQTRAQAFREPGETRLRLAGVSIDVSDRKQMELALRESEERFALAVEGSKDGIIDWNLVTDRLFASRRTREIIGVTDERSFYQRHEWRALLRLHPEDVARHDEDLRRHLAGETLTREGEYRLRQPDDSWRWVRLRGSSVRDASGRVLRYAGSVSDVTEQKQVELALRESQERYQLAVAGSNEGLWDWDLTTDRMFLSARAQQFLGLESGLVEQSRRAWTEQVPCHPDDLERVRAATRAHLRGETALMEIEYRMRHRDGNWRWFRQRGIARRDADGRPVRMAGSLEDISRRKNAEAQRDRLEAQLRQAQKLEAIGTLAGGIAHDFNNILSAILGYGEMAQKDSAEGTALRSHVDAVMVAGLRAKSLVERILAFSRTGTGERQRVHVQSVVDEALGLVAGSLPPTVRLERTLDAGDAAVLGDPTQIHQVILNLCANAVQAMRRAGVLQVTLSIGTLDEPRTVSTNQLAAGRYVQLSVHDTGEGIPAAVLERIFDPFFTTKDVGVGTGLGLSLVHGIVTDLGGGIDVASRFGDGSTFTVYLPWQAEMAAPVPMAEEVAVGAGETVLLVDDEEGLVRLGEEMLAELGYEPVGFSSGSAALASFRATPTRFHAVLTDEAMPGMTGSELVAEVRRIRADIPILMMSGYVSPALSLRAREAGVHEILAKPLVSRDIARGLAGALHG